MKKTTLILFFCISILNLFAQTGYECDFEDDAINGTWSLNVGGHGKYCANQWCIDTDVNNGGNKSLYISSDTARTTTEVRKAEYVSGDASNGVCVVAQIDLTLDKGDYEISFDWQALGIADDALYACWVPKDVLTNSSKSGQLARFVKEHALPFIQGDTPLRSRLWNSANTKFTADGTPHKLVFVWNNGVAGALNPGACIDNINIVPVDGCEKPNPDYVKMFPQDTTVLITWDKGKGDSFDIRLKSRESGEWQEYFNYTSDSLEVSGFPEGVLDMYIRVNCGDAHTVWVHADQFIYYKSNRCVDFLDLKGKCWTGSNLMAAGDPRAGWPTNAYQVNKQEDWGFDNIDSRHTIHYDKFELDPRTGNRLQTVNDAEIASVRIGNWKGGGQAEGIIYDLDIAEDDSLILLIHYAIVLHEPYHMDMVNQPRFVINFLDEDGEPLDGTCTEVDFSKSWGPDETGWEKEMIPPTEPGGKTFYNYWRDWEKVGVNLSDYAGEKIQIRVFTMDCSGGGHFAYGYFAMSCASAKLEGLSCGSSESVDFEAPEGFRYRWYKKSDPSNVLSIESKFSIPAKDPDIYACDVIQLLKPDCFYTLEASSVPRYPLADGTYEQRIENCQNVVQFSDSSRVVLVPSPGDTTITNDPCHEVSWDFGDGTTSEDWNPTHVFPEEGGTYTVTQTTKLAECENTKKHIITLPKLGIMYDSLKVNICLGDYYTDPDGVMHFNSIMINDTSIRSNGCDSIHTLAINVIEPFDTIYADTICSADLPYVFMGENLEATDSYEFAQKSVLGCDSIDITLNLLVNESLVLSLSDSVTACADDENIIIPYDVSSGVVTSFSVLFDHEDAKSMDIDSLIPTDNTLVIPISADVIPNNYDFSVTFENMDCGSVSKDIRLHLYYPDTILTQRWNDVIGIRNTAYNGGYDFTTYQWYKDGEPLEGQTGSNLYLPLVENSKYTALITREDGVQTFTCPLTARKFTDTKDTPEDITFEETSINISTKSATMAKIWNVSGVLVSAIALSDTNTQVPLPKHAGVYILEIINKDGSRTTQKFVVNN